MEQTILTPDQIAVLKVVAGEKRLSGFYLSGGTALAAYYLQHRISDDLDFFVYDEVDVVFLHEFVERVKLMLKAESVRFDRLYDRNRFYFTFKTKDELKLEFSRYHFEQLEKPQVINGLKIDSLRDIAANKLMAMLDRFDPKDFVDLYFILQQEKLESLRLDAEKKFGINIEGVFLGGELAKVGRIQAMPKMLKPLEIPELKNFFSALAKTLSPEILS